jgi:Reverse transcriptase (RNA-dependent DNA polymerase)
MVYLDDILIYSSTYKEQIKHIHKALSLLRENKLYAKRSKCEFAKTSVEYLGHVISNQASRWKKIKSNPYKTGPDLLANVMYNHS